MSREEKQQSQQAELQKQLWSIANSLRGNMDANDFKNYILGLIFYRYLSENLVNYVENVMLRNKMKYADMFKDKEQAQEFKSDLIEEENIESLTGLSKLWFELDSSILKPFLVHDWENCIKEHIELTKKIKNTLNEG